jgi:hypothetical protein
VNAHVSAWVFLAVFALGARDALARSAADEALRRQWLLHGGPSVTDLQGARARPDDVDLYDLQSVRVVLRVPATRGDAQFEVRIEATRPLPAATPLPFLTLDVDVLGVVDVAAGRPLDFVTSEAGDRTDVLTAAPLAAGGALTLLFEARFDALCTNPATCDDEGEQGHLAQFGWFPASWAYPLTDRFAFSARIGADGEIRSTATCAAAVGAPGEFETVFDTFFPAMAWGPWESTRIGTSAPPLVDALAPTDRGEARLAVARLTREVAAAHEVILGPFPVPSLTVAAIDDASGAALAPQCHVLLPARVFDADTPGLESLRREIVAHEVAHQYFFNAIGVTEPGDSWVSEAFAEHLATLYSQATLDSDDHARSNYWGYVLRVPALEDEPVVSPTIVSNPRYFEIVYLKGSSLLWMLRRAVGDETWRDLLAGLVLRFSGSIATTAEVVEFAREQLGDTFRAHERWLVEGGFPIIEARTTRSANGSARLTLEARPNPLGGFEVRLPLETWTTDGARDVQLIDLPARGPVAVDLAETVRSVRIDPDLTTFRRVRPQNEADVDLSGVVDGLDLLDLWSAGEVVSPSPRWDDRLDVNADGAIDALDIQRVRDALGDGLP